MNLMVTEIKRMVIDKAREEVHQLHLVDPDGTPGANLVEVPTAEPDWDPNNRESAHLEHFRKCVLAGL